MSFIFLECRMQLFKGLYPQFKKVINVNKETHNLALKGKAQ